MVESEHDRKHYLVNYGELFLNNTPWSFKQ